jgi:hypothetical protein
MGDLLFEGMKIAVALALFAVACSPWPGRGGSPTAASKGGTEGEPWNR